MFKENVIMMGDMGDKKNQLEILGMKNTRFEMKIALAGNGCIFDTTKEK